MQIQNWLFIGASVQGSYHLANNIPCQDAHFYRYYKENNFWICVISDGAGSCEFSHIGSGKVVELSLEHFSEILKIKIDEWLKDSSTISNEVWHEISKNTFQKVYEDLKKFANEEGYDLKSLSATVILIIVTSLGLLVTHIGDGRAGYRNENGEWKSMITPFKGEFANETVFITSPIWDKDKLDLYIESQIITEPSDAIVLLSDGCENICFETVVFNEKHKSYEHINKPFKEYLDPMVETIKTLYNQGKSLEEINRLWEEYLINGTEELALEPDDKTLIIGVKV
ncbi:MAG: PP2C family serine/threonine-protein phosphatase [Candidatus Pacearchaeota archaeon]